MSYEIRATRDAGGSDDVGSSEGGEISWEEWNALVAADPELEIDHLDRLTEAELDRLLDETPGLAECRTESGVVLSAEQERLLSEAARRLGKDKPVECDTAHWKAHPRGEPRCFWLYEGAIYTNSPDAAALAKLFQIADVLGAVVRGEDGELYRRADLGFDCHEPKRGWLPLEEFHRGRPDWAPSISQELRLLESKRGTAGGPAIEA
ncbi:hypothetical protein [Paludisphaera rhizosphaerae]|uniref:hypothetical protein n=1 Tax=Paludisphaera rhizosphaerae TaxID=2711216 RepID=UPI0013ECBD31|nr:hypothetical protein [Paludisphaera rhizosphaerae]